MDNPTLPEPTPSRPFDKMAVSIIVAVVLVALSALFFAFSFIDQEERRDLQSWQTRLGIVADGRAAAINAWLDGNFAVLRALTENAALQLYMTELTQTPKDEDMVPEAAEAGYLRNLLLDTANRGGFTPRTQTWDVPANVERVGTAGVALVDATGRIIVSTPGMPPVNNRVRGAIAKALGGEPALIDIYMGATNLPTIGFVLPVFAVQDTSQRTEGIGAVVGIRTLDDDLVSRLRQPGEAGGSAETYLVRAVGATVEYLSPLADGTEPLRRSMALDTPDLAAAFAIEKPGGFGIKRDYRGTEVLVTGRALASAPWVLVRTIARAEAMAQADRRRTTILTVFILIIFAVVVAIIAVWRHGSSIRATETAENYRIAAERFEHLSTFLRLVTDSQPTVIAAVDGDGRYTFANHRAAAEAGIPASDMLGKTLHSVIGPVKAEALAKLNRQVFGQTEPESRVHYFAEDGEQRVIKSNHIPLPGNHDIPPGVLMVLDDVTEITQERRSRERMLRQLVDTLVSVVDRRDPYSAHHSRRVAEVARCIATEVDVPDTEIETVEIAGSLMNLGKIFVPTELLTKTGDLAAEERSLLEGSYRLSGELLEGMTFEGPVVDTIYQMNETWDGHGPMGLKEDEILRTARILAVANAFVGMISPRAYRGAMTFEEVTADLTRRTGSHFDRKPVTALVNYLENRGGTEKWAHFRDVPDDTRG